MAEDGDSSEAHGIYSLLGRSLSWERKQEYRIWMKGN